MVALEALVDQTGKVSVLEPAAAVQPPLPRTRESIDPQISVDPKEIDPQSSQYSCKVTIANVADEEFAVVGVWSRPTKGLRLNESIDFAAAAQREQHEKLCQDTSALITGASLLADSGLAYQNVEQLREYFLQAFKPKNLVQFCYHILFLRRYPDWFKIAQEKCLNIQIRTLGDAKIALRKFPLGKETFERKLVEYNIERLADIESNDYYSSKSNEITLKKGQTYETTFVFSGKRGRLSPNTYLVGF